LRIKNLISWLISLVMVGAGIALIATIFLGQTPQSAATNSSNPSGFNVPKLGASQNAQGGEDQGPQDKTLELTIPKMRMIEDDTVPDAAGDDERALKDHAAIHLEGTGFPWQEGANVYIAGHRLGYPSTESWLTFWDQRKLDKGDEIYVTDAEGTKYTYRVFEEFVVGPSEVSVTGPVEGKDVLTLQTCTLPNYQERLITRAELVDVA